MILPPDFIDAWIRAYRTDHAGHGWVANHRLTCKCGSLLAYHPHEVTFAR